MAGPCTLHVNLYICASHCALQFLGNTTRFLRTNNKQVKNKETKPRVTPPLPAVYSIFYTLPAEHPYIPMLGVKFETEYI